MQSGLGKKRRTHIIIKPTESNIKTNLLITTNKHSYQLSIKSTNFHMPSISWNYPEDFKLELAKNEYQDSISEKDISPENMRFSYKISDDDQFFSPLRVFDDGKKTFIQMPKNLREAPVLFITEDGQQSLVNYRIKGDFYIVDRLFEKAELRVGVKKSVEIRFDDGKNFFERLFGL